MQRVIAIDGPSGVGKSTVARSLAERLGWTYLDTGAMYRAVTLAWLRDGLDVEKFQNPEWLHALELDFSHQKVLLAGKDVSAEIRSPEVTARVSQVSAVPEVRRFLTEMQRRIGAQRPSVLDGRDIGTVVFPQAVLKVFLTATPEVRAKRRWLQMGGSASSVSLDEVLAALKERDRLDSGRSVAPLRVAEGAMIVDTSDLDPGQIIEILCHEVAARQVPAETRP